MADYVFWRERDLQSYVESLLTHFEGLPLISTMAEAVTYLKPDISLDSPQGRALSSVISSPLTCNMALPFCPTPTHVPITVHLVGSRQIELSSISAWSLLNTSRLVLVFIGPECTAPKTPLPSIDGIEYQFIPPCTYADFATSSHFSEPDIVCAFNCGFILYSSWAESIPHMIRQSGAPLVFTEYYLQDCMANLAMVEELTPVRVLHKPQINHFRSFMAERSPVAMWGTEAGKLGRGQVVSDNNHCVIVTRKQWLIDSITLIILKIIHQKYYLLLMIMLNNILMMRDWSMMMRIKTSWGRAVPSSGLVKAM